MVDLLAAVTIEAFLLAMRDVKGMKPGQDDAVVCIPETRTGKNNIVLSHHARQRHDASTLLHLAEDMEGETPTPMPPARSFKRVCRASCLGGCS